MNNDELDLWEVFTKCKGIEHKHVGSLHAVNAEHAMESAGMFILGDRRV